MGWILRRPEDRTNPTLAGSVYNKYITSGLGVYWIFDGARVRFLLFISDGGRYGMDSITEISYKGTKIPTTDFVFHPGLLTKQIIAKSGVTYNNTTEEVNITGIAGFTLANDDPVRVSSPSGSLPTKLSSDNKYYVRDYSAGVFKLSKTVAGSVEEFDTNGTGTQYIWKADAGFDDPIQGLPTLFPEIKTTFSGICYIEGKLPSSYNTNEEPDWQDFRIEGYGRKLMEYSSSGSEIAVRGLSSGLLGNPALCAIDSLVTVNNIPLSRIDFAKFDELKSASQVLVWDRTITTEAGKGVSIAYYNFTGGTPPTFPGTATLVWTKRESQVNFSWGTSSPIEGVNPSFIAHVKFKLLSKFTETYTFSITHDDGVKLKINGTTVIDQWIDGSGTHTGTYAMTAGTAVNCEIEYYTNATGSSTLILQWSSPSRTLETIPMEQLYEPDLQIPRYSVSVAFAVPTEGIEVFDRIIQRCPGWDWTEVDGKITLLSPSRPIIYNFIYDAENPDTRSTFLEKTFEKKHRHRRERKNWYLYSYRNEAYRGYTEDFVQQDRPRLRELGGGMPDNEQPYNLMVMYRGLAQRISDCDFKLVADAPYFVELDSQRQSGIVTKNSYVRIQNLVKGDKRIEDAICKVTSLNRRGTLSFEFIPIPYPFYTDEVV